MLRSADDFGLARDLIGEGRCQGLYCSSLVVASRSGRGIDNLSLGVMMVPRKRDRGVLGVVYG
jgi:hypothetical protein